ncbi:hypothetical protein C1645_814225 [Glomus cerebriforme]|uniref:Uncharacterized protein n=1 Tax=Glomus cerebriforme TaxID=658196 RepID=A0A397TLH9_9GLOM|nr:hypothetical protein C1645_814225 [Glomus cerebriforme]
MKPGGGNVKSGGGSMKSDSRSVKPGSKSVKPGDELRYVQEKMDLQLRNVKRILEVIVGLLKDKVLASKKPANKKHHVEEIIKKNNCIEY